MASTRDIRRRIKSVKNTSQITKAMELVAASKMKKAQDQANASRPYADLMNRVLVHLKEETDQGSHPLLEEREGGRDLMIVVTTDKGLCGSLNANLLRDVLAESSADTAFITVGTRGRRTLAKAGKELLADFTVRDPVCFAESKLVSKLAIDQFLSGQADVSRVRVAFTNFVNTISQYPIIETLLPVCPIKLGGADKARAVEHGGMDLFSGLAPAGYIFEPDAKAVLGTIVPQYVNYEVYQMLLESRASEHSARMVAMKNATDNANELIKELTLAYNKQRQAAITAELLEISTAMKALE